MEPNAIAFLPIIRVIKNVKHADQIKYVDEITPSKLLGNTIDAPPAGLPCHFAWAGHDCRAGWVV